MLVFKILGEFFVFFICYFVIKIENNLFKREEVKNLKIKKFVVLCIFMFVLYIFISFIGVFMEKWNYVESFYVWFVIFIIIGFGDYVYCEVFLRGMG